MDKRERKWMRKPFNSFLHFASVQIVYHLKRAKALTIEKILRKVVMQDDI